MYDKNVVARGEHVSDLFCSIDLKAMYSQSTPDAIRWLSAESYQSPHPTRCPNYTPSTLSEGSG
jgi:hypothetical protein